MSDAPAGPEKRQAPRYHCPADAEIVVPGRGLRYAGRVVDLSAGGCFIETTCRLERGTSVELWMSARGLPLRLAASLIVRRPNGIGLRFQGVVARKLELIRMLISELDEEQNGKPNQPETSKEVSPPELLKAQPPPPNIGVGAWLRSLIKMSWIRGWLS